jgi:Predicted Zn peptidase
MANKPLPERIKEGRCARGYTQAELAEMLSLCKQAISQYENGSNTPKPETFEAMCEILQLPYSYFYKPIPYQLTSPIFFRKRKTASKKDYEMFQVKIGWMLEIYHYIKQFIEFPQVKLCSYSQKNYSFEEVIEIAGEVRKLWGLGKGPISNLSLLLENNGFLISKVKMGAKKVDACSVPYPEDRRPIVFTTPDTSAVRSRRDMAHETGHQFLHSTLNQDYFDTYRERLDVEAEWFASAFLMPPEAIKREAYSLNSLDSLLLLKKRWGVSAQSILYYLKDLELVSLNQFKYLSSKIYSHQWRFSEPFDEQIKQEEPQLITEGCKLILDNNVKTIEQFIDDLPFSVSDIEDLCGFEANSLIKTKKAKLELVK